MAENSQSDREGTEGAAVSIRGVLTGVAKPPTISLTEIATSVTNGHQLLILPGHNAQGSVSTNPKSGLPSRRITILGACAPPVASDGRSAKFPSGAASAGHLAGFADSQTHPTPEHAKPRHLSGGENAIAATPTRRWVRAVRVQIGNGHQSRKEQLAHAKYSHRDSLYQRAWAATNSERTGHEKSYCGGSDLYDCHRGSSEDGKGHAD
jgi:hypothetical protein